MSSQNSILLKQLNEYKRPLTDQGSIRPDTKEDNNLVIVKLINFEFYPKKIKVAVGSLVQWVIGQNHSSTSKIYDKSERSFFLSIEELDIQSPQLFSGSSFSH